MLWWFQTSLQFLEFQLSGEATNTDEKTAKEFPAMTQKAAIKWMAFLIVMKRAPIMNTYLKGPPSQRQEKWPRFEAIKDLRTLVFSINAQQRTMSQAPTAGVTTFCPISGTPPLLLPKPYQATTLPMPMPQDDFRSLKRQSALFIAVFMYFFTS